MFTRLGLAVLLVLAVAVAFCAAPAATPQPVRIMTLGDSITQGDKDHFSYRYWLWTYLVDSGVKFSMVGSMTDNSGGNPKWPPHKGLSFDSHHEGHWGWRVEAAISNNSKEGNLTTWLAGYTPDIVLIHMGTVCAAGASEPPQQTAGELKQVIDVLRQKNPAVKIFLAKLIPSSNKDYNTRIDALNALIPGIAAEKTQPASPVTVVDMNTGFNKTWLYDALHPAQAGEQFIAQQWLKAMALR